MTTDGGAAAGPGTAQVEPAVRVSTLELFFDLVFVFTVTQLTNVLSAGLTATTALRIVIVLGVTLWMYGGYAWLTNVVAPTSSVRRGLLITGMAGFLTMALAIPTAFTTGGLAFGIGYFVVNLVHTGLFWYSGGRPAGGAIRQLAPLNLTSATMILVGGAVPDARWRTVLWAAAFALQIASPYLHRMGSWPIAPAHFVERHGLVVIVALGESVVAIGLGAAGHELDAGLIAVAVLGLVMAYLLWWTYFGGDDEAAEHALAAIPPEQRGRAAIRAFGYAHYPILLGIVVLAAGVKKSIGHAFEAGTWSQVGLLGGGVAIFLFGDVLFRRTLRIGALRYRTLGAVGALATIPLGRSSTVLQLVALVVVLTVMIATEDRARGVNWLRARDWTERH